MTAYAAGVSPRTDPDAHRLVAGAIRHGGGWVWLLLVSALTGAAVQLALPAVLGRAIDALVATASAPSEHQSRFWLSLSAALVLLGLVATSVRLLAAGSAGATATARLRLSLMRHLLRSGPGATRDMADGDLVTRMVGNADEVGRVAEAVIAASTALLPAAGALVALALLDPWLAVTFAVGLTVIMVVLRVFLRETTAAASGYQQAQAEIAGRLLDALGGAATIAASGTVARETARVLGPVDRLRRHGLDLWRTHARAGVRAALGVPLLEVSVLAVGGWWLMVGRISLGELTAAARYAVLGAGLGAAVGYLNRIARARAAARRCAVVLSLPAPPAGTRPLPPGPGRLELRAVTVHAARGTGVQGVDLIIEGGRAVAVVGRSGAGKSLLAAVAGRLRDPDEGEVLLDGVPLRHLDPAALRQAVGYAFGRPVLFGETIGAAIEGGSPGRDPSRLRAAARAARADGFIARLPNGYRTPLRQTPLSGGELQRVGLARAFLQAERVLILDDAMSSLDTVTELEVGRAVTADAGVRTRIIVAHRAATAARADTVVWLEAGRVRAVGPHHELWQDPGYRAVFVPAESAPDAGRERANPLPPAGSGFG